MAQDVVADSLSPEQSEQLDSIDTIEACIRYVEQSSLTAEVSSASYAQSDPTQH